MKFNMKNGIKSIKFFQKIYFSTPYHRSSTLAWLELHRAVFKPAMFLLGNFIVFDWILQTARISFIDRWWRAPEIYINWEQYDGKVDLWSVGCIMADMILLKTTFPGTDHLNQLDRIFDIVGTPNVDEMLQLCPLGLYKNSSFEL